ncbi:Sporulation-specific protein SPO7 [Paramyrothecium foliicola]|nr:Sporulation-specific protein SPO7 [Paramyrothecium foliicola]
MADDIDSIVKGAPVAPQQPKHGAGTSPVTPATGKQGDPLNHTPSSPSMIYLNLLILEASLRAQYLELRARRRHHTFFLILLTLWVAFFGYELRFAEREDGVGVGGSIYWAVEGVQKVCFMGGIVTAILIWATGIWERGIRWPRRWFVLSNRGLRGFNCKLVIIRRPWWAEALSTVGFFLTYGLFSHNASSSYRHVDHSLLREADKELQLSRDNHPSIPTNDHDERHGHEEDLAPGGDYVKLLLLAKPFSATFRENWELYRTEYWERENERRALLRKKVKEHDRHMIKQHYRWFWWLPWLRAPTTRNQPPKALHPHRFPSVEKQERRRRGSSVRRSSVSSSRSQTPTVEGEELAMSRRPSSASASSTTSEKRRKKAASLSKPKRPGPDSRSVTPDIPSPLARESSAASDSANDGGRVLRSSSVKASSVPPQEKT